MRTGSRQLFPSTSLFFALSYITKSTLGNVTWVSPSDGDVYGPGDTILGEWISAGVIASPTFRLCFSNSIGGGIGTRDAEGGCGSYMSPAVGKSAGTYLILLWVICVILSTDQLVADVSWLRRGVPNITKEDGFYLQMEDDYGKIALSPDFSLSRK
jgi:hypothetical protein